MIGELIIYGTVYVSVFIVGFFFGLTRKISKYEQKILALQKDKGDSL